MVAEMAQQYRLAKAVLIEKLGALVPLPRVHLVHYGGCVALHNQRRGG